MGFLVGVGQVAHGGVGDLVGGAEGEGLRGVVSRLELHFGKVDAPAVHPGRRSGFEPAKAQAQGPQVIRQAHRGVHAVGTRGDDALACDDGGVQVGSRGDDDGFGGILRPQLGENPGDGAVFHQDFHDLGLLQLQIFLELQGVLHILLIGPAVGLGPEGVDGGPFAPVQHPVLDAAVVCGNAHFPAQGVQLPDQVALARAADGGVAGHIAYGVQIDGEENGVVSKPGRRKRRLDAGVAGADYRHITASCVIGHRVSSSLGAFFSSGGRRKGLHTTSQRWMGVPRAWNFSS